MTNLERVDQIIADIHRTMHQPNWKAETPGQVADRAKRLRSYANGVIQLGGNLKPEYRDGRD